MKVAIIGGGPCGLATLRFLAKAHEFFPIAPLEVRLFEAEDGIGGSFAYRVYEDAELVSSKYLTCFSDFRLPHDVPDFITPQRYVQYLKDYVDHFKLAEFIELKTNVNRVRRYKDGKGHVLDIVRSDGILEEWHCDAVAVCSGLNVDPFIPKIPGIEKVKNVLHSSQMKSRQQFGENKDVVIFGAGETAMDAAHLAVTSPTTSVTLCHREGFFCAPKIIPVPILFGRTPKIDGPNKPVDASVASLFDTAYAHPILQRSSILWSAYDTWIKTMHTAISGTAEGPDQWVGHMSRTRKHVDSLFMVKSDRAIPYMSADHRTRSWWNRIRAGILNVTVKETNGRTIDVVSWPSFIDDDGFMRYEEACGSQTIFPRQPVKPDLVIFATGFKPVFRFLGDDYPSLDECNQRRIYKDGDVTIGFIGFCRPSLGAIPPIGELQAQLWVYRLLQHWYPYQVPNQRDQNAIRPYELSYELVNRSGHDIFNKKGGVDHESFAYQLAVDIGSAPTIAHVMRQGWKVFFTWAMGSNFNPKFRIVGPWKLTDTALGIMEEELYNVVKRSGGYVYILTYTVIPFILFGTISILLYALCGLWSTVSWLFNKREEVEPILLNSGEHCGSLALSQSKM